jgi:hypothetical protein
MELPSTIGTEEKGDIDYRYSIDATRQKYAPHKWTFKTVEHRLSLSLSLSLSSRYFQYKEIDMITARPLLVGSAFVN